MSKASEATRFKPTHGMSKTSTFRAWVEMQRRCFNSKRPGFHNYGGRGISVCDRWLDSFENFLEDMGEKPSKDFTLERIDVNGNYEPSNCRWATWWEQARNKRTNVFIGNEILSDVARRLGCSVAALSSKRKRHLRGLKQRKYYKGADHVGAKLSHDQVKEVKKLLGEIPHYPRRFSDLAKKFRVGRQVITGIYYGRTYK